MIVVELTALENEALQMVGDAPDTEVQGLLHVVLLTKGAPDALGLAVQMTSAVFSARRKIEEATRYQIKVVD